MTTELYLVRHGESVPNVEPVIGGLHGDAGLTARGREQAGLLERRLRAEGFRADQLYASTLPRALETAEYVARALDLPVQRDDELHELRPGVADGMDVDEWRRRYGPADGEWNPYRPFAPDGESWAGFLVRAGGALAALVERHPDETVVAVCHGGVVDASFALAFGLGGSGTRVALSTRNTSITHWRHHGDGRREWTLLGYNDAAHLAQAAAQPARDAVPTPAEEH